jgi:hypothetical protein
MDRSVVRHLQADARADQSAFGDFFRIKGRLEFLLPTGDIDNGGAPLSIDREAHEGRRFI